MSDSDDHRRDVAGRFSQAMRGKVFELIYKWFPPELAEQIARETSQRVEEEDLQREGIEVILNWFRSEEDVRWLDEFWQSPMGSRFLDLSVEFVMRANLRQNAPHAHAEIPPPGETT